MRLKTATIAAVAMFAAVATAQAQTVFLETFGNAQNRVDDANAEGRVIDPYPNVSIGITNAATGSVADGFYTVMSPLSTSTSTGQSFWTETEDHTGDTEGAVMVLNAGDTTDEIYVREFDMEPGKSYRVSAWRFVVNGGADANHDDPINWAMGVVRDDRGAADDDYFLVEPENVASTTRNEWEETVYEFSVPVDCDAMGENVPGIFTLYNRTNIVSGNDLYIDDIMVEEIPPIGDVELCPSPITSVPTLDIAGLGLLSLLGAGLGAFAMRRRRREG